MADTSAAGRLSHGDGTDSFMEAGILMVAFVAAFCSSPQTAEINAQQRAATLQKWVKLGLGAGAVFLVIAATTSDHPGAVLAGGGLAGGMLWASYRHASTAGLASDAPGTEG